MKHIEKTIANSNPAIAKKFGEIVEMRNRIIHGFRVTSPDGEQFIITEKYLIDFGYIETISASIYDNDNCLSLGFKKFLTTDYDVIAMFSLLMMMDEGIDGHCFFVFDELGFIAYPHDDTGFGFIRIKNTKVHYEDLFLKNVSQFSDFTSVVKGNARTLL